MKKIIQLTSVLLITFFISFTLNASEEIIKGRKQIFKKIIKQLKLCLHQLNQVITKKHKII